MDHLNCERGYNHSVSVMHISIATEGVPQREVLLRSSNNAIVLHIRSRFSLLPNVEISQWYLIVKLLPQVVPLVLDRLSSRLTEAGKVSTVAVLYKVRLWQQRGFLLHIPARILWCPSAQPETWPSRDHRGPASGSWPCWCHLPSL